MRTEIIVTILDTVSFVLVTPRLVGIANLRKFNRSGFSFLSRIMFDTDGAVSLPSMSGITVGLIGGIALVTFVILPWLVGVDATLFGKDFNAATVWTPLNITLGFAAFLTYAVVPLTLFMGWMEILMSRYDPEGAMLLAGGLLFAAARFLSILQATAILA